MTASRPLKAREDELFSRWRMDRPGLVADGVVDESAYLDSPYKIMVVLKEVNDKHGGGWDLRNKLRSGGREATWNNVTRWVRGIRALPAVEAWSAVKTITESERRLELRSIVAINVKKSPGGHTTDTQKLKKITNADGPYLNEQLSLYEPDLVLGCGSAVTGILQKNWDALQSVKWDWTGRGVRVARLRAGAIYLDFVHPEVRVKAQIPYFALMDAVREARGM